MSERPFELIMHYWPDVVKAAQDPWARRFALSIARQARNRRWRPTPKQIGIMQRMVQELFTGRDEGEVIE